MTHTFTATEVRSDSGLTVGWRLTTHPGGETLLIFADQRGMPGFRVGDAFTPGYCRTLANGETVTFTATEPVGPPKPAH
jgi:hypothetical protein